MLFHCGHIIGIMKLHNKDFPEEKMMMKKVGIRELKTHLSGYIEKVKSGERLIVSERAKPVACIIPFDTQELQPIWSLVENHSLHWDGTKPKGLKGKIKLKGIKLTSQYVAEDREK